MVLLLVAVHPSPAIRRVQDYAVQEQLTPPLFTTLALALLGKYAKMEAVVNIVLVRRQEFHLWKKAAWDSLRATMLDILAGPLEACLVHATDFKHVS